MQNKMLVKGKGELVKIAVDSICDYDVFAKKGNKKLYINLLKDAMNINVCLIAYCVLDRCAHFILKAESPADIDFYVKSVNEAFAKVYDGGNPTRGYPFRAKFNLQKIKSDDLDDAVIFIHSLAPDNNPQGYSYCSYGYLYEGSCGGARILINEMGGDMSRSQFSSWLQSSTRKKYYTDPAEYEDFKTVLNDSCNRYLDPYQMRNEEAIIFVISEVCVRTGAPYKKVVKHLAIDYKSRHDLLIGTICELIERRKYTFDRAYVALKLVGESYNKLAVETLVETNRKKGYSYDYIASAMGFNDNNYDILVEILCGLRKQFRYGFEEMCVRFHLQNDIIEIRNRCGF